MSKLNLLSFILSHKIMRALSFYYHFYLALLGEDEIIFYSSTSIHAIFVQLFLKILYPCNWMQWSSFTKKCQFKRNGIIIPSKFFVAWFYSRKSFVTSIFRNLELKIPTIYLIFKCETFLACDIWWLKRVIN